MKFKPTPRENMNIEIAPSEYWIRCTYDEAVLYCFQLKIGKKTGWRLPTYTEIDSEYRTCWYESILTTIFNMQQSL